MAKEVAMYGGDISSFLSPEIAEKVREKYAAQAGQRSE
jgi:pantetheine-phosphate adenylyltransferase